MSSNVWSVRQPLPVGIADAPAVAYGKAIFIFGGYGERPDDIKSDILKYSPVEDKWSSRTPMSKGRWGAAATMLDRFVYVFGGVVAGRGLIGRRPTTTKLVERYDVTEDTWTTLRTLPAPLRAHGLMAATANSKVYLFNEAFTFEYDPNMDTYKSRANAPVARRWASCAHVKVGTEDRIYIIAGYDSKACDVTDVNYYYLPSLDKWVGPREVSPYRALGVTRDNPVWQDEVYFGFGHRKPDTFYRDMYAYNPLKDTWTPLSKARFARDGVACAIVDDALYVIGGRNEPKDAIAYGVTYNERLELSSDRRSP